MYYNEEAYGMKVYKNLLDLEMSALEEIFKNAVISGRPIKEKLILKYELLHEKWERLLNWQVFGKRGFHG